MSIPVFWIFRCGDYRTHHPGRNLAVIVETAAMNNRQKKMGYNAAKELMAGLGMEEIEPEDKELEIWKNS